MVEGFRTFDLSELDDKELHAYHLGISFAILRLREQRKEANAEVDKFVKGDDMLIRKLTAALGAVEITSALSKTLDTEHFTILQEKAKRQEENKNG